MEARGIVRDVIAAVLLGAGVTLAMWGTDVLRLDVGGQNLMWLTVLAFGITWRAVPGQRVVRALCALGGFTFGVVGVFLGALNLPLSSLGRGIAVGATTAVVVAGARALSRLVPVSGAMTVVGLGAGFAVALSADLAAVAADDVIGMVTAAMLAFAIGTFASYAMDVWVGRLGRKRTTASGTTPMVVRPVVPIRKAG